MAAFYEMQSLAGSLVQSLLMDDSNEQADL